MALPSVVVSRQIGVVCGWRDGGRQRIERKEGVRKPVCERNRRVRGLRRAKANIARPTHNEQYEGISDVMGSHLLELGARLPRS